MTTASGRVKPSITAIRAIGTLMVLAVLCAGKAYAAPPPPVPTCNASTAAVNFGIYDVFLIPPGTPCYSATGTITVTCDAPADVVVTIGPGSAGSFPRKMSYGAELLEYYLYQDARCKDEWTDISGVSKRVVVPKPLILDVYGRITPLQDAGVGAYSDTLTVTVTY
jgi:spore coat protein U-like protein